ncbi:MAG: hypothetical protein V8R01_01670 [Bacilli bacterium]
MDNKSIKLPNGYSWDSSAITHDRVPLNEYLDKNNIIYSETLTSSKSVIQIDNLNILRDGGHYEFELISQTNNNNEVQILVNGINYRYYQISTHTNSFTSGSHDITPQGHFADDTDKIDGWMFTASGNYQSITKGDFWLAKNDKDMYKLHYMIEHECAFATRHSLVNIRGVHADDFENVTSLTFKLMNSGNFLKNTKIIIRKIK